MLRTVLPCLLVVIALSFGCDNPSEAPQANPAGATADVAIPASVRLSTAPEGAKDVAAAKSAVKDGDRIVVRGIVAGRVEPIAKNRAILTLLDPAVPTCDRNPADKCETPWDACCEPQDVLSKGSVTVQVVDSSGNPLRTSLESVTGIKPLAELIVTGIARVDADGIVVINADGVFVVK